MRLKICCCYCTDEGPTFSSGDSSNGTTTLPRVVAEQPKLKQPIQLDKISADKSAVPNKEGDVEAPPEAVFDKGVHDTEAVTDGDDIKPVRCTQSAPATDSTPSASIPSASIASASIPSASFSSASTSSASSASTSSAFSASTSSASTPSASNPSASTLSVSTTSAFIPKPASSATFRDKEEVDQPKSEVISDTTLTKTSEQNQSTVSFTVLAPGHFKCLYKGTEFYILNGEIERVVGPCEESDREFIMAHYASAMQGVKQAMEGLEKGLLGLDREVMGTQVNAQHLAPNVTNILAALHHPPSPASTPRPPSPRINRADFEKFLAYLRNEVRKEEEIRSVDDRSVSKKAQLVEKFCGIMSDVPMYDECDGGGLTNSRNRLSEPALEKTTFTAKEAVYEDPKTFEILDTLEVPEAKRADEYIISRDECLPSGYYFHAAKPRRARKKVLNRRERLQLASPGRYDLFQDECLKLHNKYRSMHGVPPLVNNDFLCKVAREWAEHLALKDAFYHRPNNEYGENLFTGERLDVCARSAVAAWYDEIDLYDYDNPKFDKSTGHFTQLIWKDTVEMGTGVAQIGNKIWVCCNYHPPGNHLDKFNDKYVPRPVVMTRKS